MAAKHNIDSLTMDVERFKKSTNRRLTTHARILNDIQPKVQEMHEYIIDQRGFERGQAKSGGAGSININKEVWALITKLVLIIAAILGITKIQ